MEREDYQFMLKVIRSCKTIPHFETAKRMVSNLQGKADRESIIRLEENIKLCLAYRGFKESDLVGECPVLETEYSF